MNRMSLALMLTLFCTGAWAQTSSMPGALHPQLPGGEKSGTAEQVHFHFKDGDQPVTQWMRGMGRGVAQVLANRHHMSDNTVVQYGPPSPACKAEPSKPECP